MKTKIIKIDPISPEPQKIQECAEIIKAGGVVATPTETVYGLFANALDSNAVAKIFTAKGRPSDNPLIVHIATKAELKAIVNVDSKAEPYINNFWPGPLTLILPKTNAIPNATSANLSTIGVRMPSHPVANALISAAGLPLAGPSANTSGRPSPTSAQHVIDDLNGKVDCIMDAGVCSYGLESTVLDPSAGTILRPGSITLQDLSKYGNITYSPSLSQANVDKPISPGQKYKHYAPKGNTTLVLGNNDIAVATTIAGLVNNLPSTANNIIIITTNSTAGLYIELINKEITTISLGSKNDPSVIAKNLYNTLRICDTKGAEHIFIEGFNIGNGDIYASIMDRLAKAASYNIINV
jgi:L-threonylcarbamoyladenylate synthase